MRVVSTDIRLVSMGSKRMVASRITPVSPMPPTVAQNNSGRRSGPTITCEPSASSIVSEVMWLPNEPST